MNKVAHLNFLDGIRGYAALYVLVLHCMIWGGWYGLPLPDPKVAVDVFMIMSGFLMTRNWDKGEYGCQLSVRSWGGFLVKRFFRIAPLYYTLLIIAFVCAARYCEGFGVLERSLHNQWAAISTIYNPAQMLAGFTVKNFLMHVSFLFGLSPKFASSTFMPDWSIGLEMQFYVAFPLLLVILRRLGHVPVTVLAMIAAYFAVHLLWPPDREPSALFLKLPAFLVGMLAAEANRLFSEKPGEGVGLLLLAIATASQVDKFAAAPITVACLLFLLVSAREMRSLGPILKIAERVLGNRVAKFAADTSYGVYLVHPFFLSFVGGLVLYRNATFMSLRPYQRVALLTIVTFIGSYGCAYVLHRLIEQPGMSLGNRLLRKIRNPNEPRSQEQLGELAGSLQRVGAS